MAINYTTSYTFTAGTTISSSQVNTNFSDNTNTWTGLEALTKTFAKLKVDVDPSTALEVATKQYVDHYATWRRPVLQLGSATVVNMETGLTGTSGQAYIVFPDGSSRTDSTTGRINCNMAQVAALTVTAQSGLDTGTASANTWYSFYAVKSQVNTTDIVHVASLLIPTQANFSTLNTRLGASSWVYLGTLPYGDGASVTTSIPSFKMAGNRVVFNNTETSSMTGIRLANTAGATSLTWTYASGTALGSAQVPGHLVSGWYSCRQGTSTSVVVTDSAVAVLVWSATWASSSQIFPVQEMVLSLGLKSNPGTSVAIEILLSGYTDGVLGVGSLPLL